MRFLNIPEYLVHALGELGVAELPGATKANSKILAYWKEANVPLRVNDDSETPWCAAFVGAMLFRGGVEGSRRANAKSYATWGDPWTGIGIGAVVVFDRKPPAPVWTGHVGFCVGLTASHVHCLGGNQRDKVSIAAFPRSRVVDLRRPKGVVLSTSSISLPVSAVDPTDR